MLGGEQDGLARLRSRDLRVRPGLRYRPVQATRLTWLLPARQLQTLSMWGVKFILPAALVALALTVAACGGGDVIVPSGCTALNSQSFSSLNVASLNVAVQGSITPAVNWQAPHKPGELLVSSGAGLSAQALTALSTLQAQQVAPGLLKVTTPPGKTDQEYAAQLEGRGLKTQPDFVYQALAVTNDPGFPGNAGVRVGGLTVTQSYLTRTRVPEAWDAMTKCQISPSGAVTAVVDSAVDATHPDLSGRVTAQVSYLASSDTRTFVHGTATAGIIAATANNDLGLSGIGQQQGVISEEVIAANGATTSSVVKAVSDALNRGAKVINLSLGMAQNPGDSALDSALASAANTAVLVAAAGNTADNVYYPASLPSVIAVGAVGKNDGQLAWYSARPSSAGMRALDIVAPGGEADGSANDLLVLAPQQTYALEAGTSFAAPQVAGVAALMRAANPNLSAAQTRALLLQKVNSAAGLPLLDAQAAVTAAITGK